MTSVLFSSPNRRDFGHHYGPKSSGYDSQFSNNRQYVPRESSRSFLPSGGVSRRSVSLNRPSPTFSANRNVSILDEIIDRRQRLSPAIVKNRFSPPIDSDAAAASAAVIHRSSSRSRRLSDLKVENEKLVNKLANDRQIARESESIINSNDGSEYQKFKIEEIYDSIGADQIASLANPIITFCEEDNVSDVQKGRNEYTYDLMGKKDPCNITHKHIICNRIHYNIYTDDSIFLRACDSSHYDNYMLKNC
uniref:Uncharacterized protein n=1 Tax=Romanomermis culicivorax TaxID=13658 RepID=A0A915JFP0_ROMCU